MHQLTETSVYEQIQQTYNECLQILQEIKNINEKHLILEEVKTK